MTKKKAKKVTKKTKPVKKKQTGGRGPSNKPKNKKILKIKAALRKMRVAKNSRKKKKRR
jgi:hypothetical protein